MSLTKPIHLRDECDVDLAIGVVGKAATEIGLPELHRSHLACAVSELSTNAIRHGLNGKVFVRMTPNGIGLEVEVSDEGPGIEDIDQALVDGFTSSSESLGIGLGASKRAVEYFHIDSLPGSGTKVVVRTYPPLSCSEYDLGLVSLPDSNYFQNGDHFVVNEVEGDRLLVGVIDGLGQGVPAHRASTTASRLITANRSLPLLDLVDLIHDSLRARFEDSGVALGLASIGRHRIEYLGIGDTSIRLFDAQGDEVHRFFGTPGIVGSFHHVRGRVESCEVKGSEATVAVFHTDGLSDRFSGRDIPLAANAQDIADHLMYTCRRPSGDSTVLVLKR